MPVRPTLGRRVTLAGILAVVAVSACGGPGTAEAPRGLTIVTTVSPITDLVRTVAGPDIDVVGLVPEGVNSHTYEPRPSDARALARADLVITNGLFLELPSLDLARASTRPGTPIVSLGEQVVTRDEWVFDTSFPEELGHPNPHLWTDPVLARAYVDLIEEHLTELAPDDAAGFTQRADALRADIDVLDAATRAAWSTVPEGNRRLVTYHDSWPYFGRRYGVEVIAAIQPSDFAEPSLAEVRRIIEQVREAQVPAIFGSEVFPSDVLEQIAESSGATYIDDLRDDDLPGETGDAEHSYLGMMVANVRTMVTALGGDASALDDVPLAAA